MSNVKGEESATQGPDLGGPGQTAPKKDQIEELSRNAAAPDAVQTPTTAKHPLTPTRISGSWTAVVAAVDNSHRPSRLHRREYSAIHCQLRGIPRSCPDGRRTSDRGHRWRRARDHRRDGSHSATSQRPRGTRNLGAELLLGDYPTVVPETPGEHTVPVLPTSAGHANAQAPHLGERFCDAQSRSQRGRRFTCRRALRAQRPALVRPLAGAAPPSIATLLSADRIAPCSAPGGPTAGAARGRSRTTSR